MAVDVSNIFYHAVDGAVTGPLDARKSIYGSPNRDSNAHAWLHRKMAWAEASANNKKRNTKASISVSNAEFDKFYTPQAQGSGVRFLPKPYVTSVKISSDGDFGTLRKCEVAFTVFSIGQLDSYQPFFDIGADVTVSYGWNEAGSAGGPTGKFSGIVYNFSYSANSVGGFDCVSYGVGPGIGALAGNIRGASDDKGLQVTDALGTTIKGDSLLGWIQLFKNKAIQEKIQHNRFYGEHIGAVAYSDDWGVKETPPPGTVRVSPGTTEVVTESGTDEVRTIEAGEIRRALSESAQNLFKGEDNAPLHYYISLEGLVIGINYKVFTHSAGKPEYKILCNGTYTKGNPPPRGVESLLVSGNPKEILFPAYGYYGDIHNFFPDGPQADAFAAGDLSKIMLSIDWVSELLKTIPSTKDDSGKSVDTSVSKFMQSICDSINVNSGTRFKLALVQNPENANELILCDINYVKTPGPKPYVITAVNQNTICRSLSLSSKVPSKMAAAAYVNGVSTFGNQTTKITNLTGGTAVNPEDDGSTASTNLEDAKKRVDAKNLGPTDSAVSNLQSALERAYIFKTSGTNEAIPFPLDLSVTLDGIEGFKFGDAITTNYLPSVYSDENKIVFVVTKVDHSIENNDWTTTLSTICRLL